MADLSFTYRAGLVTISAGPLSLDALAPGVTSVVTAAIDELAHDARSDPSPHEPRPSEFVEVTDQTGTKVMTLEARPDRREVVQRVEALLRRVSPAGDPAPVEPVADTVLPDDLEAAPEGPPDLLTVLRQACEVLGATPDAGRLRRELETRLGPAASTIRAELHLVVVAAEEGIPMKLTTAGTGRRQLRRVAGDLAQTRHLTKSAAEQTVKTWAEALHGDA